jgi:GABA(A) receptor-associated protein
MNKDINTGDYKKIKDKYPERIPVIVQRATKCNNIDIIDKNKFLVPKDLTVGQFIYIIRKRIKLSPDKSLYIFCNDILPPSSKLMDEIAAKNDYTYIYYSCENTFG